MDEIHESIAPALRPIARLIGPAVEGGVGIGEGFGILPVLQTRIGKVCGLVGEARVLVGVGIDDRDVGDGGNLGQLRIAKTFVVRLERVTKRAVADLGR